ncbi:CaiF/GrlA family transcriptional regulator [Salmonella enterica subsp. enterica serovar Newport]|nr:CaiF/GrlA family transcriptional regulator [Salmonella enterica subsp. enterica serovar Newport]
MTGKLHSSNKLTILDGKAFVGKNNLKKAKQSNHCEYSLPSCMASWADEPLYLVVARWCLLQKRWINRNDIAAVFHMPNRQASFQLSYISRKKDRVACRIRHVPTEGGGRKRVEVFIDYIFPEPQSVLHHAPPRRRNVPAKQTGSISRGVGSAMVDNIGLWERLLKRYREDQNDE